jgi:hypothetical protein
METEDFDSTETDHEKKSQKKMDKSSTKEDLGIDPEKSKVKIIK